MKNHFPSGRRRGGFSLIELMVAMSILSVLLLLVTVVLDQVQKQWNYSESRLSQFREARVAFDLVTKNLGQASLNTYWDLEDEDGDGVVDGYFPTSELHFVTLNSSRLPAGEQTPVGDAIFFQAPLGFSTNYRNLNNLYNGRGYFVAFGGDSNFKPSFVDSPPRYRYRLMEFRPPAEANQVFADGKEEREADQRQVFDQWWKQALSVGPGDFEEHLNPLAENIVTLVVAPRDTLETGAGSREDTYSDIAPRYEFDSNEYQSEESSDDFGHEQQVPPLVRVTMVAIDETAAVRLEDGSSPPDIVPPDVFQNTSNYHEDVKTVTQKLNEQKINHKIFSTMVMLRSSTWSNS